MKKEFFEKELKRIMEKYGLVFGDLPLMSIELKRHKDVLDLAEMIGKAKQEFLKKKPNNK